MLTETEKATKREASLALRRKRLGPYAEVEDARARGASEREVATLALKAARAKLEAAEREGDEGRQRVWRNSIDRNTQRLADAARREASNTRRGAPAPPRPRERRAPCGKLRTRRSGSGSRGSPGGSDPDLEDPDEPPSADWGAA